MTRRQILGLLALSLLSSATWLLSDLLPLEGPPLFAEGLRLLLCSAVTPVLIALRQRTAPAASPYRYLQAAAVSLGVVALPSLLSNTARGRIASTDGVLIFALMPVATMLIVGWMGREQHRLHPLPSALLGVAGVMILLPVRLPEGAEAVVGACLLTAAMLLAAASTIWLHLLMTGLSLRPAIPAICLLNGLILCLAGAPAGWSLSLSTLWPHALRAILYDLPQLALLIWLLQAIPPQRLAARYLIAPLFTVIEGLFLIRPHFDSRTLVGLCLLAVATAIALFSRSATEPDELRLNL